MRNKKNYDYWEEKFDCESQDTVYYDNVVVNTSVSQKSFSSDIEDDEYDEESYNVQYDDYISQSYYGA